MHSHRRSHRDRDRDRCKDRCRGRYRHSPEQYHPAISLHSQRTVNRVGGRVSTIPLPALRSSCAPALAPVSDPSQ